MTNLCNRLITLQSSKLCDKLKYYWATGLKPVVVTDTWMFIISKSRDPHKGHDGHPIQWQTVMSNFVKICSKSFTGYEHLFTFINSDIN